MNITVLELLFQLVFSLFLPHNVGPRSSATKCQRWYTFSLSSFVREGKYSREEEKDKRGLCLSSDLAQLVEFDLSNEFQAKIYSG